MEAPLIPAQRRVKLAVRNVYAPTQTLVLDADPSWRVCELKTRLQRDFPTQPAPAQQKLIFGGKICEDDTTLAQVLAQVQTVQTADAPDDREPVVLHLLLTSTTPRSGVLPPAPAPTPSPAAFTAPTVPVINTQRLQETVEAQDSPRPSAAATPAAPMPTTFAMAGNQPSAATQQQELYRHGLLMQQQAMLLTQIQYLQYLQLHQRQQAGAQHQPAMYGAPFANMYGIMPPHMFPPHAATPHGHAAAAAAPPPAPAAPVAPRERPLVVQMAREVLQLLDLRLALKMGFMLFLIGQDTPTDRLLMLALLSLISYLHITGIFAKIYEVYHRGQRQETNAQPNADAADEAGAGARAGAGANVAAAVSQRYELLTRVLRIAPDRGLVQDVKYFVVGLLLSLVPAWHPQPVPVQGDAVPQEHVEPEAAADAPLRGI